MAFRSLIALALSGKLIPICVDIATVGPSDPGPCQRETRRGVGTELWY